MARGDWPGVTGLNDVDPVVAARAYAAAGIPVFPVYSVLDIVDIHTGLRRCECMDPGCGRRAGKHARVRWGEGATTDVEQITEWWTQWPSANIGVPTGGEIAGRRVSGWLAIDLDTRDDGDGEQVFGEWLDRELGPEAASLLETLAQRTGSGGKQLIFRDPGGVKSVPKWLHRVDIRSEGGNGYIIVPPSKHASGKQYRWLNENSPQPVHERVAAQLRLAKPNSSGEGGGSDVEYDYRKSKVEAPPLGARDDFFNRYAFELRRKGWSKPDMVEELRRVWERTPGGGAPSGVDGGDPYRWGDVAEKIERIWRDVAADPEGREPVADELVEWARADPSESGDAGSGGEPPGEEPPSGGARVVNEPPHRAELATDLGNATRYARVNAGRVRYVPGIGWFAWNGVYWQPDELGLHKDECVHAVILDIQRQAERSPQDEAEHWIRWSLNSQGAGHISAMVNLAAVNPGLAISVSKLDADPWIIAVQNGVVDFRKGELREGRREDYCTRVGGVEFQEGADCPMWKKHIELISSLPSGVPDPELALFLQRWAGYTLTGLVDEQRFAFCYGEGNNGKNVFIETLMSIMGTYAMTSSAKLMTGMGQEHETLIADLAGPRLVFVDETPKGRINETRVKQLTGSKKIRARKIAKDSFEFDARFKLWIAGNHKPRVSDTTEGLWRRLDLIPFSVTIPAERRVKDYARMLVEDEGPGILNWMLEGLVAYCNHGLERPTRVATASRAYRAEEDLFGQFVSETFAVDIDRESWVWHPNSLLHGMYESWCTGNGIKFVPSMQQLASDWERWHFERDSKPRRIKTTMGGSRVARGWWGPPLLVEVPAHLAWT